MSLTRILSSEPLPLHPTELRDGVYSKAAIDKYIRDLHNYLRRLTGFFTADNLTTEIDNGGDSQASWAKTQWTKAYVSPGFTTDAAFTNLVSTATKPAGQNILESTGSRVLVTVLSDVASAGEARVVGWRRIGGIWFPELIALLTPSGASGIVGDGTELSALLLFPQTHSVANGNTERQIYTGASGYTAFGIVQLTHNGCELIQIDARITGAGTKASILAAQA